MTADRPRPGPRFGAGLRHPGRWLDELTGDGPSLALVILFGLNAVDELARVALSIAGPSIADEFDTGMAGVTVPFVLAFGGALALSVPIATIADRGNRVRLALLGGVVFSVFSVAVGLAWSLWGLAFALAGMQVGKAFIEPSHTSLLTDYYPVDRRPRVFAVYRAGNAVGALVGGVAAGYVAQAFGWRAPFLAFAVPTLVLVAVGAALKEPTRGAQEQRADPALAGLELEDAPPSLAEAWRMCWQVDSLRRIYRTLPFLTPALVGFALYSNFAYRDVFGLDDAARGWVVGLVEGPSQLAGLMVGGRLATRRMADGPGAVFALLARALVVVALAVAVFAWSPHVGLAVAANVVVSAGLAFVVPGLFVSLALVVPPRARSTGFALASVFVLAGLVSLPVASIVSTTWGMRWGIAVLAPVLLVGGLVVGSAGGFVTGDVAQVWAAAAARTEALAQRRAGRRTRLLVRGLDVAYDGTPVLTDVGIEADEGEVVALLGTNGAGKSTLLGAIAGLVPAHKGAVVLDGRDTTYAPAHELAPRGVALVPGGWATFPSLTVAENLRAAGWARRHTPRARASARGRRASDARAVEDVLATFPPLRDLLDVPAANLSGGQQHMLGLGMALLAEPKLLLVDELSLGLAPAVVEQLVAAVRRLAAEAGTTVVVVDQSLEVALSLAERAYFLDKGRVQFEGRTADLLERPDLLRSTFLGNAVGSTDVSPARPPGADGSRNGNRNGNGTAPAAPALELVGVRRSFGGITAVDGVSLTVGAGEVVGLIGPNGAGKSTLVDLASGALPAESGTVRLDGADVTRLPTDARARRGLARSFQQGRLFPGLTVETCLAVAVDRWSEVRDPLQPALFLPAAYDEGLRVAARVDELIDLLGLGPYRRSFAHELSTGTRRVVELACVMALEPTVVLLDEPSSGLAQREAEALAPLLLRLRDELGASLLLVEHDMALVTAVSDRLVALDLGRVVTDGPPDAVLAHPDVVASYLGTTVTRPPADATPAR